MKKAPATRSPTVSWFSPAELSALSANSQKRLADTLSFSKLYGPLLRAIYQRPVVLVLTCKNLSRLDLTRLEVSDLRSALFAPATKGVITFQWLG